MQILEPAPHYLKPPVHCPPLAPAGPKSLQPRFLPAAPLTYPPLATSPNSNTTSLHLSLRCAPWLLQRAITPVFFQNTPCQLPKDTSPQPRTSSLTTLLFHALPQHHPACSRPPTHSPHTTLPSHLIHHFGPARFLPERFIIVSLPHPISSAACAANYGHIAPTALRRKKEHNTTRTCSTLINDLDP